MKKSAILELMPLFGDILRKGGALPPGSIRVWGGKEYIKVAPGKWRLRNVQNKDSKMEDSIVETDYEKSLADRELKKVCFLYAREKFQGKVFINNDTGNTILVSRDGLDKWNFITKSREQSISIKKLDSILKDSKKVDSQNDKKGRKSVDGFTYFEYTIKVNSKPFIVKLATRETHGDSSKYYYHYLEDIKIEPDPGMS